MRIEYSYNKYDDSENATEISHFLNRVLCTLYPLIGIGNLLAILFIGDATYDMLDTNKGFDWRTLIVFLIVYVANILLLLIKFSIDIICGQVVLREKFKDLSKNDKKLILKNNRNLKLQSFLLFTKLASIYLPLIVIGIASFATLVYAIKNVDLLILLLSLLILFIDVFACIFINKKVINKKNNSKIKKLL